jgi:hypothetical protein
MYEIHHYLAPDDKRDLYVDWLLKLKDTKAKIAVVRRVSRIEQGNFGDHKFCRDGVWDTSYRRWCRLSDLLRHCREGSCTAAMWR